MAGAYPCTLLRLGRRFVSKKARRHYLFGLRWVEVFVCPSCGFRGKRLKSASWGKLFYRQIQQAMKAEPVTLVSLAKPQSLGGG